MTHTAKIYDNERRLHQFTLLGDGDLRWRLPRQSGHHDLFFNAGDFATNLRMLDASPRGHVGPVGPCGLRREGTYVGITTASRVYWFGPAARDRLNSLLRRPLVRTIVSV